MDSSYPSTASSTGPETLAESSGHSPPFVIRSSTTAAVSPDTTDGDFTYPESVVEESLEDKVRRLSAESDLLRSIASIRLDGGLAFALGSSSLRSLNNSEIDVLESLGNTARDWSLIQVADGFNARRIRDCEFHGRVILGRFKQYVTLSDGLEVLAGLSRSTIADCVIGHNALIRDVRLLANYVIAEEAIVVDCGRIICRSGTSFGNGQRIPLALEGGGREVEIFAEIDVELAALVARLGNRRDELDTYRRAVSDYRTAATSYRGVIGREARIWGVQRVEDTFVGPMGRIDGATQVVRSTLLSLADEPVVVESGSLVADSLLQWGARVTELAVVESSVLIEHSRVERHGKVKNSLIGSSSEISAGEVSSCLLGPLVNCPHQSLLISTYWPEGRGNIGYGANVGSNHTSRAPDQEFRAGEGLFIGLGSNVKFPCDFSESPYTVIACGVDLPPQKVSFPFSLITQSSANSTETAPAAGLNRIRPGWMLYENTYALKRNEAKFRARNRSRRAKYDFSVIRREMIEFMRTALRTLYAPSTPKTAYSEREIPGLGKNVLLEGDRVRAIEAYRFHIRHHALLELKQYLEQSRESTFEINNLSDDKAALRKLLAEDFQIVNVLEAFQILAESSRIIAENCERTRRKDEIRGIRIIDDYESVHPGVDRDRVVRLAYEEAEQIRCETEVLLSSIFVQDQAYPNPKLEGFQNEQDVSDCFQDSDRA